MSRAGAIVIALSALAGCAGGDSDAAPTTLGDTIPLPSVERQSTTVETTVPATDPSTSPASSSPATTAATAPTTATTEPPATTVEQSTTTTEPLAAQELLLRGDGIGAAFVGAEPEGVIGYITSILGGNTGDTGWVDPFTFAACDGTVARRVDWGVLRLLFSDLSDTASDRRHFMGWEYGSVSELGGEPVGLHTPGGTTLGSRVVDLLADFPEAAINEGEDDLDIPPNYYVSDNFRGLLTGTSDEDVVVFMAGGYGCGE